jgi:hypothetical protein
LGAEPDRRSEHGTRCRQAGDRNTEALQYEDHDNAPQDGDPQPGEHLGYRVPVLAGLRADEGVFARRCRVDASRDPIADPLDEAG